MSTLKKSKAKAPSQLTLPGVPAQLAALELGLGVAGAVFSRIERKKTRASSDQVPTELIELVAMLADGNGGTIAGMPFDAADARDALAQVSSAQAAVRAARQFAQRVEDDATMRRYGVANRAFGIYSALKRFVRTPEGAALKDTYDQMQSVVRAFTKARKPKASVSAPAKADASTSTEAPAAASAAVPTTVVAEKPAAVVAVPAAVAAIQPASTTNAS